MKLANLLVRHTERSLFKRYLLSTMLSIIGLFVFLGLTLTQFAVTVDDIDRELRLPARAIGEFTTLVKREQLSLVGVKVDALNREFSLQKINPQDFHYAMFDTSHSLLTSSAGAPLALMRASAQALADKTTQTKGWYIKALLQKESSIIVVVAASEAYFNSALVDALLPQMLQSMLITLLVSIVVVWLSSRYALRPLSRLVQQVKQLKSSAFEQLVPKREFTELKPLINAINARTQEAQANLQRERAFFSDAAHELRTPLAVINAQAYRVVKSADEAERWKALHALEAGVKRAASLLANLLNLARMDATASELDAQGVDLTELSASVVAQHANRAYTQGQEISLNEDVQQSRDDQHNHLSIKGNENDVRIIIENLVDNAIRYAGQGACIVVETGSADAQYAYLTVSDNGPGMTQADEAQAFERFKRGSLSDTSSGSGLGLAIVKSAVVRLGGTVQLSKGAQAQGLCVKVQLLKI